MSNDRNLSALASISVPLYNDLMYVVRQGSPNLPKRITYAALMNNEVNVRAYGALGDGVTDDAAAFALAAAAVLAAGGGILKVPAGTYIVGDLTALPANCWMRGAGRNSTTIKAKSTFADVAMFTIFYTSYVTISDMTLNGNRTNVSGTDKDIVQTTGDTSYCVFRDLTIESARTFGLQLYNTAAGGLHIIENCIIRDCGGSGITMNGNGVYEHGRSSVRGCILGGNNVNNSVNNGDVVAYQAYDIVVHDNISTAQAGAEDNAAGIRMLDCLRPSVQGNHVNSSVSQGILVTSCQREIVVGNSAYNNAKGGVYIEKSQYGVVNSNNCYGNGWNGVEVTADSGIFSQSTVINGNNCQENGWAGVRSDSDNVIIGSNICRNNGQDTGGTPRAGIHYTGGHGQIVHNQCYDDQGGGATQLYGILAEGTSENYNLIQGNQLSGNVTANLSYAGVADIVRDNIGYVTRNKGRATKAHGGTIAHGLAAAPTSVQLTARVAQHIIYDAFTDATNITVGLINRADGATIGAAEEVDWQAEI